MKRGLVLIVLLVLVGFVYAADIDGDGVEDDVDNCYNYYNPGQDPAACEIVEHVIYLEEGWNLVSFPLNFGLITAKSLNQTLDGALDSIFFYYRNDTYSGWHYYRADFAKEDNTLNVFDPSYGFWMKVKGDFGDINLTLRAPKIFTGTQRVYSGYNLIGYPRDATDLSTVFGTELDHLDVIFMYNTDWSSWGSEMPTALHGITQALPGYGLWIYSDSQRDWTIDDGVIS